MNQQTAITTAADMVADITAGETEDQLRRRITRLKRRIMRFEADYNQDQETIRSLTDRLERTEATLADVRDTGAGFERGWHRANAEITELQSKLMAAQLNEAAAIARLDDDGLWSRRWQAEAEQMQQDREALEGQLNDMRSRSIEVRVEIARLRSRNLWQRIINR